MTEQKLLFQVEMEATAKFSACRTYRYTLWRIWGGGKRFVQFIGLNPSTADEFKNDPTVRRCIIYAKDWGFDGICMTNLFAYRSTNPAVMKKQAEPIGEENDEWLLEIASRSELIVAAWEITADTENVTRRLRKC